MLGHRGLGTAEIGSLPDKYDGRTDRSTFTRDSLPQQFLIAEGVSCAGGTFRNLHVGGRGRRARAGFCSFAIAKSLGCS